MSMYNMIYGVNPATWYFLPMLGKHPDEYPRFRDCFIADEEHPEYDNHIQIYTRTGGGNREEYEKENEAMRNMDGFVTDYDDSFDSTYASWVFKIPEKWQADFDCLIARKIHETSKEYRDEIKRVFPKLASKIDESFKNIDEAAANAEKNVEKNNA